VAVTVKASVSACVTARADLRTMPRATSADPTKAIPGHADRAIPAPPRAAPKSALAPSVASTPRASIGLAMTGAGTASRAAHSSAAEAAHTVPSHGQRHQPCGERRLAQLDGQPLDVQEADRGGDGRDQQDGGAGYAPHQKSV
jgi:hypothetical protein